MFQFDLNNHTLETLEKTPLKAENILERYDLQRAIVNSWDLFKSNIGFPAAYLIGQEVPAHSSTQNAIDLVAFDPDDSSIIVIELKRDKNKLQLLQALSYAGMVHQWGQAGLLERVQKDLNPDYEELVESITVNEINKIIKIVLISEYYDPEVIITADWLYNEHGVDITAFSIELHKMLDQYFLQVDQKYPLRELADSYKARRKERKDKKPEVDVEWEDVLPNLQYPFAKKAIELCKRIKNGDPSRRRFVALRPNYDGFDWIDLYFRNKHLRVYIRGDFDRAEEHLQSKFSTPLSIGTWRDGYSFAIETEEQFQELVAWLKLE